MMTKNETIYFSSQREGPGTNNIYRSEFVNGRYAEAVKLGDAINTEYREFKGQVTVRYYGLYANAHRGKVRKASASPLILRMAEEQAEYF